MLPHHPQLRRGGDEPVGFLPYRYAPRDEWALWGYAQSLEADHRLRRAAWLLAPLVAVSLRRALSQRLQDRHYDVVHVHWLPSTVLVDDIAGAPRGAGGQPARQRRGVAERLRDACWPVARCAARERQTCSGDLRRRVVALGARRRAATVPYGVTCAFAPRRWRPRAPRWAGGDSFWCWLGRWWREGCAPGGAAARTGGVEVVIAGGDLRAGWSSARARRPCWWRAGANSWRPRWRKRTWWWCRPWSIGRATWTAAQRAAGGPGRRAGRRPQAAASPTWWRRRERPAVALGTPTRWPMRCAG
jgi:hypothetical protein